METKLNESKTLKERHKQLNINIRRRKNHSFFRQNRLKFYTKQKEGLLKETQKNDLQYDNLESQNKEQLLVTVNLEKNQYKITIKNDHLAEYPANYELYLNNAWKKPVKELHFIFKSLIDTLINPNSSPSTRLHMVIFAQNIASQGISFLNEDKLTQLYTEDQVLQLVNFLTKLKKNEAKVTFWMMHLLMKIQLSTGLLKKVLRDVIKSLNKVLNVTDSLRVFEIVCDFILFLEQELSFTEFKKLIQEETSTFVCIQMNLDAKISNIILNNINVGFKAICAVSVICAIGAEIKLLTSAQNCFVNALTIFKSLGVSMSNEKELLSNEEIVFLKSIMEDAESLKKLMRFFMTYAYLVNNENKTMDLYLKNLPQDSIILMFRHGALEVRKSILYTLSNIFIDLPIIQSQRYNH